MKKYILICLCFILFKVFNYAQAPNTFMQNARIEAKKATKKRVVDTLKHAEYAFEGEMIKHSLYTRNNQICFSQIFKINKVFKGNLKLGTVEVLQIVKNILVPISTRINDTVDNRFGKPTYICICRKGKEFPFNPQYNIDTVDNKVILTTYSGIGGSSIKLHYNGLEAKGLDSVFSTKGSLYRYFKTFPRMKIPTISAIEAGEGIDSSEYYNRNNAVAPPPYVKTKMDLKLDSLDSVEKVLQLKRMKRQNRLDSLQQIQQNKTLKSGINDATNSHLKSLKDGSPAARFGIASTLCRVTLASSHIQKQKIKTKR